MSRFKSAIEVRLGSSFGLALFFVPSPSPPLPSLPLASFLASWSLGSFFLPAPSSFFFCSPPGLFWLAAFCC